MMYFIESVRTLSSTGNTRKGAALQAVVNQFEHTILVSEVDLKALFHQLQVLVDAVNARYPGKPVFLHIHSDSGYICAGNDTTGNDGYIFSIHYAPVGDDLRSYNIRPRILESVKNIDRSLFDEYHKRAYSDGESGSKGGDR